MESFKNDDILLALAGLEKEKDEKAYKEAAADCLFALLAKIRKSSDDKEQVANDKANKKPTLQEMIVALNPATMLFPILEDVAEYDENTKVLSIDCKNLYTQLGKRIEKQTELLAKAKTTYEELEATVEAEVEAKKLKLNKPAKQRKVRLLIRLAMILRLLMKMIKPLIAGKISKVRSWKKKNLINDDFYVYFLFQFVYLL